MHRWIIVVIASVMPLLAMGTSDAKAGGWYDRGYGHSYYYRPYRPFRPYYYAYDAYPAYDYGPYYRPYYYRPFRVYAGYGWGGWRGRGWGHRW